MSKIDELLKRVGADFNLENKTVKATVSTDGEKIINIRLEILKDNSAKILLEKFEEYVNTLPDDLFTEVLDMLGQEEVNRIDECIHSEDIESVRSGILKFKRALRQIITDKITQLNQILPSCK